MHADVAGDDHLQPRQADAGVGQLAEVERALRVGHIHHDLQRRLGHRVQIGGDALEGQGAGVDVAGIALGAAHGDLLAVLDQIQRVAGANHGRHAQFAGDDRRVAGAAATVGHNRGRALHHRLPVGVGHVGHQHIAGLDLVHVVDAADHAGGAAADALADGAALGQHRAALAELVTLHLGGLGARLHRLRARLQDVDAAGHAVLAPLDIHRPAVVLLDHQRLAGQLVHIFVGNGELHPQIGRRVLGAHALTRYIRIHHAHLLAAQRAAQDGRLVLTQRGLVDVELVRVHRALDHHLAQAVAGGDKHHIAEAGFGVQGKQHARSARTRAHHQLHAGRQGDFLVLETMVHAVGDRAVVVEAGEHFLDLEHHVIGASHVQEGFLLAGEAGVRQIFGGCRGAHRHRHVATAVLGTQLGVGLADIAVQLRLQRRIHHPATDFPARFGQRLHVFHVQRAQAVEDPLVQRVVGDERLECVGSGGEPARYRDAQLGQVADHLAQRGILAADLCQVIQSQVLQPEDVGGQSDAPGGIGRRRPGDMPAKTALF